MAASGKKTSSSQKSTRKTSGSPKKNIDPKQEEIDSALFREIELIILFVVIVFLFLCNFGIIGPVGNAISGFLFGVFGFMAYVAPVVMFIAAAFWMANTGSYTAVRKLVSGVVLFLMLEVIFELISGTALSMDAFDIKELYSVCSLEKCGGGILGGSIAYFLKHYLGTIGAVLIVLLCSVISGIFLTERSFIDGVKKGSSRIRERTGIENERYRIKQDEMMKKREADRAKREEERAKREEERKLRAKEKEEEKRLRVEEKENEQILRMEKRVQGVTLSTTIKKQDTKVRTDDVHEITIESENNDSSADERITPAFNFEKIQIKSAHQVTLSENDISEINPSGDMNEIQQSHVSEPGRQEPDNIYRTEHKPQAPSAANLNSGLTSGAEKIRVHKEEPKAAPDNVINDRLAEEKQIHAPYQFPSLDLLKKGKKISKDTSNELRETAIRLQQTLENFGVRVTITDISQGPSVTRYELQPEQGVKVSKIVGLSDDIKLNLAATDIRIEAPIPGKAAIGIEVPNKETMMVALRDLLESRDFLDFNSNIAFAVGKDIAGKTVVADIAKMPHMLIAGSTGSGKSVCINTLIMSILYKAHPDDVKLIMVDPKVVELSVYNGIPHLLLDVVTDPKKASAALHWGVTEMEDRYKKLAEFNVRDLKEYNKKVEAMRAAGDVNAPKKMPQIVIIVDELADLMMVCPGEVEESICRLAQLARAAGIHLVIATQRPSVDVITGLIKANMPSRVAFAVSSGVDSRTILDMNGAEKLLGKGDMLFYPQGYSKPARIQGAFVSDGEVSDVVDFLKNQRLGNTYAQDIEEKLNNIGSAQSMTQGSESTDLRDEYFEQAGRFIIDKDKASIGMLQRVLKVGFNRAARIMDQLCDYGVVGEEEGTKPRKVLMSIEQFEQLLEEI